MTGAGGTFPRADSDDNKKENRIHGAFDAAAGDGFGRRLYLGRSGVTDRLIDVSVGRANPPDAIKNQRVSTAEQARANAD